MAAVPLQKQQPGERPSDTRYARRSAHLPHLGEEACLSALDHLPTPDRDHSRRRRFR